MRHETKKRKNGTLKTMLAAALMVGAVSGIFYGGVQVAATAENTKTTTLPTSYPMSINSSSTPEQVKIPDGYVKPDYTVADNSLEYYRNTKPTANDISRDKAAEIGVQALWSAFELDLNGKTIEMGYDPAEGITRAKWSGEYWIDGQKGPDHEVYTFTVDAVTGEICQVVYGRILDVNADLGYDAQLAKNPSDIEAIAQKFAEKLGVVGGAVKSTTIHAQGYSYNDPNVSFRIVGENGQLATIGLSRYDNALLSVSYNCDVIE